jgi:hypothetical protein
LFGINGSDLPISRLSFAPRLASFFWFTSPESFIPGRMEESPVQVIEVHDFVFVMDADLAVAFMFDIHRPGFTPPCER